MRALLLLGLAAGCGADASVALEMDEPTRIVWRDVYGSVFDPPAVEWKTTECPSADWRRGYAVIVDGECAFGWFFRDASDGQALVAVEQRIHESAFAHELLHAFDWRRDFNENGHQYFDYDLVDLANAQLEAAGY